MFNFDETISGNFAFTVKNKTYTGVSNVIPENFFDGDFGSESVKEVINGICEEQDYSYIADDVSDWTIDY